MFAEILSGQFCMQLLYTWSARMKKTSWKFICTTLWTNHESRVTIHHSTTKFEEKMNAKKSQKGWRVYCNRHRSWTWVMILRLVKPIDRATPVLRPNKDLYLNKDYLTWNIRTLLLLSVNISLGRKYCHRPRCALPIQSVKHLCSSQTEPELLGG